MIFILSHTFTYNTLMEFSLHTIVLFFMLKSMEANKTLGNNELRVAGSGMKSGPRRLLMTGPSRARAGPAWPMKIIRAVLCFAQCFGG